MTITLRNIRRELYNQVPGLGFSGTADSLTGATLTDTFVFKDTTIAVGHYRGMYMYRPALTTDDRLRRIISHVPSTGVVTVVATYSDTSDTTYEVVGLMHPDELNACIQRAMTRIFYDVQVVLPGDVTDGDMETSGTGSWTASSGNLTLAKTSIAANVFSGVQSMRATSVTTANMYAKSATIRPQENRPFFASAVVRVETGSVELVVWNETAGTIIGSAVATDRAGWSQLWINQAVPDGCEELSVRLRNVTSTTDAYWDHAVFYQRDKTEFYAPSWLDEQYKFLKLREARYVGADPMGTADATTRTFHDWTQPSDFTLEPLRLDAHPYMVQLRRPSPLYELWIQGKRPYSDSEPLTTSDTDTTHAPERLIYAYARQELGRVLRRRYPADKRWEVMLSEADLEVQAETSARPELPMQPIRREEWVGYV
jgi:hypothetical protein